MQAVLLDERSNWAGSRGVTSQTWWVDEHEFWSKTVLSALSLGVPGG